MQTQVKTGQSDRIHKHLQARNKSPVSGPNSTRTQSPAYNAVQEARCTKLHTKICIFSQFPHSQIGEQEQMRNYEHNSDPKFWDLS